MSFEGYYISFWFIFSIWLSCYLNKKGKIQDDEVFGCIGAILLTGTMVLPIGLAGLYIFFSLIIGDIVSLFS